MMYKIIGTTIENKRLLLDYITEKDSPDVKDIEDVEVFALQDFHRGEYKGVTQNHLWFLWLPKNIDIVSLPYNEIFVHFDTKSTTITTLNTTHTTIEFKPVLYYLDPAHNYVLTPL